jgi:hypothetical protein
MVTIGQSPRRDLVAPFAELRPDVELVEAGALDGFTLERLPVAAVGGDRPLTTRMRDGSVVTLDEWVLAPLVQEAVGRVERRGVAATLLLCAGPFPTVRGERPLVKPFGLTVAILRSIGAERVGVIVPIEGQRIPAERAFIEAGLQPVVWVATIEHAARHLASWIEESRDGDPQVGHVVLDYVGHSRAAVAGLQRAATVPVLDLGLVAAAALAASV